MGYFKEINIRKGFGVILSFEWYYPLLDINCHRHSGKITNIHFILLRFEIDFYFYGSDLPF